MWKQIENESFKLNVILVIHPFFLPWELIWKIDIQVKRMQMSICSSTFCFFLSTNENNIFSSELFFVKPSVIISRITFPDIAYFSCSIAPSSVN